MKLVKALLISAVLVTGAVHAEEEMEPTDPSAIAREELMQMIGKNIGILGDMAGAKTPYDAAAAEAAKAALVEATGKIKATFTDQGATDPASAARPEIWTNWATFVTKADAAIAAAGALDPSSAATIGAGMEAFGGACKACHADFRMKQE